MSVADSGFGPRVLELIDAGTASLGKKQRGTAATSYAQACELLFRAARETRDYEDKVQLTRRAQQLLTTVQHLRDQAEGGDDDGDAPPKDGAPRIKTGIRFADVAGLENVKETLHLRLIYPLRNPEKLEKYGLRAGGGLLLYGPPGTGKTMIAKAVAGELELPFFAIKPSEVLSKYYGESTQKLAALFDEARQHTSGAIIFIDEIDSIGIARGGGDVSEASRKLVTQLLQELDGVQGRDKGLLFLAATNEPWLLDDALLRPGRFDEKCYVPLPDVPARLVLLKLQLKGCWLGPDVDLPSIVDRTERFSGADLMCLCERAKQIPFREAVLKGTERPVMASDFDAALQTVRPSVSLDSLKRYDEYSKA